MEQYKKEMIEKVKAELTRKRRRDSAETSGDVDHPGSPRNVFWQGEPQDDDIPPGGDHELRDPFEPIGREWSPYRAGSPSEFWPLKTDPGSPKGDHANDCRLQKRLYGLPRPDEEAR